MTLSTMISPGGRSQILRKGHKANSAIGLPGSTAAPHSSVWPAASDSLIERTARNKSLGSPGVRTSSTDYQIWHQAPVGRVRSVARACGRPSDGEAKMAGRRIGRQIPHRLLASMLIPSSRRPGPWPSCPLMTQSGTDRCPCRPGALMGALLGKLASVQGLRGVTRSERVLR